MAEKTITFTMLLKDLVSPVAEKIKANVAGTTASVTASVNAANAQIANVGGGTLDKGLDATKRKAAEAAAAVTGSVVPAARAATAATRDTAAAAAGVVAEHKRAADQTDANKRKMKEWGEQVEIVTKAAVKIAGAFKAAELAIGGVKLVTALVAGDVEKQFTAVENLDRAIRGLPGGDTIAEIGGGINDVITSTRRLSQGGEFKSDREVTAELEKQNKLAERFNEQLERQAKLGTDAVKAAREFTDQLRGQTDTEEQAGRRLVENVKLARQAVIDLPGFNNASKGLRKLIDQFKADSEAALQKLIERQAIERALDLRKAQGELEAAQLESLHRTSEADRVAFRAGLDEKQRAAAKVGGEMAKLQERINNVLLATFDAESARRKREFLAGLDNDLSTRLLRATGVPDDARTAAALDQRFQQERQRAELLRSLDEQGATAEQADALRRRLADVQALEAAQLRLKQAVELTGEAEQRLTDRLASAHALVDTGQVSLVEGSVRIRDAQARYNDEVARSIALLERMRADAKDPAQAKAIDDQIEKVRTQAAQANLQIRTFGTETGQVLQSSLEPAFSGLIQGTLTVKEAFKSLLQSIARGFADLAAKILANALVRQLLGGVLGGGAGTGAVGAFFATPLAFAAGGPVPGGYGGGDVVPALLEPGEHILTKEQVRSVGGSEVIARLFGGRVLGAAAPVGGVVRMSTGGAVSPSAAARSAAELVPTIVADEATLARLLAGGSNALVSALGRRKDSIRRVLGIE